MKPTKPVVPGRPENEVVYAEDQPQYRPLPALMLPGDDGRIITRWSCSWRERLKIFLGGDIYLHVLTFNKPLQPVLLTADKPNMEQEGEGT